MINSGLASYEDYQENQKIYGQNFFYPSSNITDSIFVIRTQRILNLYISPVQYNSVKGQIRIVKKMKIQINFSPKPEGVFTSDPIYEPFFKEILINYDVARFWRRPRILKKTSLPIIEQAKRGWYKIPLTEMGIYKITYQQLKNIGIPLDSIQYIHLYTGIGHELSKTITDSTLSLSRIPLRTTPKPSPAIRKLPPSSFATLRGSL